MRHRLLKYKGHLPVLALKGRSSLSTAMAFLLLTVGLSGCVKESVIHNLTPGSGPTAAFTITVPGMKTPSTRALDATKEQKVSEVDVVIFENSTHTLVEYHRVPGSALTAGSNPGDWRFTVEDIDHASGITAAIIANASQEVSGALSTLASAGGGSYIGASKTDFLAALNVVNDGKWNTSPGGYWTIPMYGEVSVTTGSVHDTPHNAPLTRMLAKVDVVNDAHPAGSPVAGDFELTAVHVVHYNGCGAVAPKWNPATGDIPYSDPGAPQNTPANPRKVEWQANGDELTYILPANADRIESEIYLFECRAQSGQTSTPAAPAPDKETRLVFEGDYTDSDGITKKYYYPVDFHKDQDTEYIPVLRNTCYRFTIEAVSGRGYERLDEAVAAMGVMSNLKTSLLVVDESNLRYLSWNGEYFLGSEDREVILDGTSGSTLSVKCVTNYAAGWEIDQSKGTGGIEYAGGSTGWLSAVAITAGDPKSYLELEALSSNTGTGGADRTATVHLKAGRLTHTLKVTQEYVSIARQFARSNIVWDATNNKLTFAVTEADNATIPANSQGVFFKWGSLVAVSPVGANYASSQILFSPSGTTNYTWANIPYISETTGKFGTHGTDEDDFAGYDGGSNTNGPGFNASTNKGDICRYISDRGWVQGKWRLPTSDEQQALINEVTSVSNNGGFGNITGAPNTGNNAHGFWQVPSGRWLGAGAAADAARNTGKAAELVPGSSSVYFPAGGYRGYSNGYTYYAGYYGYSWSASSYNTTYAYNLNVYSGLADWNYNNRNYGFTVRCIRE